MKPYQQYLEDLTKTLDKIEYTIIPRAQNQFADTLAILASMVEILEGVWTRPLEIEQSYEEVRKGKTEASIMTVEEEEFIRRYDFMKFLELGVYPDGADKRERHSIRPRSSEVHPTKSQSMPSPIVGFEYVKGLLPIHYGIHLDPRDRKSVV